MERRAWSRSTALGGKSMMRAHVGRTMGVRKGIILRITQRAAARLGGIEQVASTDEAFVDFASLVERLLCDEIVAYRRDVGHADTVQPMPYVVIDRKSTRLNSSH